MIIIYHNPRCKKSRLGLDFLKSKNLEFTIVEYLKNPLSSSQIANLFSMMDIEAGEIVRKQEAIYKSNYKGQTHTNDEWSEIMSEYPKLMPRPIIVNGNKAVFGDPITNIDKIL